MSGPVIMQVVPAVRLLLFVNKVLQKRSQCLTFTCAWRKEEQMPADKAVSTGRNRII